MPNGSLASIEGPWGGRRGPWGGRRGPWGGRRGPWGGRRGPWGGRRAPGKVGGAPGEVVLVPKCASQGFVSVGRYGCFGCSVRLHCAPPGVVISIQIQSM